MGYDWGVRKRMVSMKKEGDRNEGMKWVSDEEKRRGCIGVKRERCQMKGGE